MSKALRPLPADIFVQMHNVAEAFGGVGSNALFGQNDTEDPPVCLYGIAAYIDGFKSEGEDRKSFILLSDIVYSGAPATTPALTALLQTGLSWSQIDDAVHAMRPRSDRSRVDFLALADTLGLTPETV
jgi:hypothetical protein